MKLLLIFTAVVLGVAPPAQALHDPPPDAAWSAVQGEWKGSLTYRDYRQPDKLVTLPTRLFTALGAPNELVLHYVFDDGPGKQVYSYERIGFDAAHSEIVWRSGAGEGEGRTAVCKITRQQQEGELRQFEFEQRDGNKLDRYSMTLGPRSFRLEKNEVDAAGAVTFRNRFEFTR